MSPEKMLIHMIFWIWFLFLYFINLLLYQLKQNVLSYPRAIKKANIILKFIETLCSFYNDYMNNEDSLLKLYKKISFSLPRTSQKYNSLLNGVIQNMFLTVSNIFFCLLNDCFCYSDERYDAKLAKFTFKIKENCLPKYSDIYQFI